MDFEDRNVVLVVLDSLTAFRLPFYGCEEVDTPFLSELTEDNLKANFAYSTSSWSVPSHASMFTGKLPSEHNCTSRTMKLEGETLAEKMNDRGYSTASITTNYFINKEIGFNRGFDKFINHQAEVGAPEHLKNSKALEKTQRYSESHRYVKYGIFGSTALINREWHVLASGLRYLKNGRQWFSSDHGAEGINRLAKKFASDNEKFFAFLNYMEIHSPETVSDKEGLEAYDDAIEYLDSKLEELYNSITEKHPDSVFIVTADHGESHEFYRYGDYKLTGHQYALTERNIRVPLIIAGKDIEKGKMEENVSLKEIHDLVLGEKDIEDLGEEEVYSEYMGAAQFLRRGEKSFSNILEQLKNINWKKISRMGLKMFKDQEEVKDLHLNKSFALVDSEEGYILNTHLPDQSFKPEKNSFTTEQPSLDENKKQKLQKKYSKYM